MWYENSKKLVKQHIHSQKQKNYVSLKFDERWKWWKSLVAIEGKLTLGVEANSHINSKLVAHITIGSKHRWPAANVILTVSFMLSPLLSVKFSTTGTIDSFLKSAGLTCISSRSPNDPDELTEFGSNTTNVSSTLSSVKTFVWSPYKVKQYQWHYFRELTASFWS